MSTNKLSYLPHLDGLRGVAVLAVILFHFDVPFFRGGYVGVDIFLSMSGFLITTILLRSGASNHLDLRDFYLRRFFRLYPASTVTLLVSIIFSFIIFPDDLALRASKSALASLFFCSNIHFHMNDNYFDAKASLKPLLHMWSLSLEEQFYIVWAPFLVLVFTTSWLSKTRGLILIGLLTVLSFSMAEFFHEYYPSFSFFELPPRIFQFSVGAILAIWTSPDLPSTSTNIKPYRRRENGKGNINVDSSSSLVKKIFSGFLNFPSKRFNSFWLQLNMLSLVCIATIFGSVVRLPVAAPPHLILPTTISTAILIIMPADILSSRILSLAPIRFIGRMSYSMYLVHWPLYVYSRYILQAIGQHENRFIPFFETVCTLVLGFFMYRFIEAPVRKNRSVKTVCVLILLTLCSSLIGINSNGFNFRSSSRIERRFKNNWKRGFHPCGVVHENLKRRRHGGGLIELACGERRNTTNDYEANDVIGKSIGKDSTVMFVGNSYIHMWATALGHIGVKRKTNFKVHHLDSCPFVPPFLISSLKPQCRTGARRLWSKIRTIPPNTHIGLSFPYLRSEESSERLINSTAVLRSYGLRPFVISISPGFPVSALPYFACADLAKLPISNFLFSGSDNEWARNCVPGLIEEGLEPKESSIRTYQLHKKLCKQYNIPYIDMFEWLCKESNYSDVKRMKCRAPGNFSYGYFDLGYMRDLHHLSDFGSFCMSEFLENSLVEMGILPFWEARTSMG